MAAYKEDYADIDLKTGTIHRTFLNHSIGKGDNMANRYGVRLFRGGEPVNVNAGSCQGYFMAPDGTNIALTGSTLTGTDGNLAWVQLPQACYNAEGQFTLAIKVIVNGVVDTMRIIDGVVNNTGADGAVAPVGTVPTYQEVLAVYEQMLEAKNGAVRYDIVQALTKAQRTQARNNIGMVMISFAQIGDTDEYIMEVSTACVFTQIDGDEYALMLQTD